MKNISATILTELAKQQIRMVNLIETEWGSGNLYLTNHSHDIVWQGNTYLATGHFLSIADIEETLSLKALSGSLMLSGLDNTIKALAIAEDFNNKNISIYLGFLQDDDSLLDDPILLQKGILNGLTVKDDPSNTTSVKVDYSSIFARFEDVRGRRSNPTEHKTKYPTDTIFDFVPDLAEKIIYW